MNWEKTYRQSDVETMIHGHRLFVLPHPLKQLVHDSSGLFPNQNIVLLRFTKFNLPSLDTEILQRYTYLGECRCRDSAILLPLLALGCNNVMTKEGQYIIELHGLGETRPICCNFLVVTEVLVRNTLISVRRKSNFSSSSICQEEICLDVRQYGDLLQSVGNKN